MSVHPSARRVFKKLIKQKEGQSYDWLTEPDSAKLNAENDADVYSFGDLNSSTSSSDSNSFSDSFREEERESDTLNLSLPDSFDEMPASHGELSSAALTTLRVSQLHLQARVKKLTKLLSERDKNFQDLVSV